jgi:2'-5' RNA ligase
MSPPGRRLFFAFWPDEETRYALARACRKAIKGGGGRPVAVGNLHVTVAFLGFVPQEKLAEISAVGAGLRTNAFDLVFDQVGHWPRPQVLVALCSEPPPAATALAAALWERLKPLEIPPDLRPYQPHVTLARKVRRPGRELAMRPVLWPVAEVALVESVTDPDGARYAVLERWPLAGENPPAPPGSPPEPPPGADSPST